MELEGAVGDVGLTLRVEHLTVYRQVFQDDFRRHRQIAQSFLDGVQAQLMDELKSGGFKVSQGRLPQRSLASKSPKSI